MPLLDAAAEPALAQAPAVGRGEAKTRLKQSVIPSLNRR